LADPLDGLIQLQEACGEPRSSDLQLAGASTADLSPGDVFFEGQNRWQRYPKKDPICSLVELGGVFF